MVMWLSVVASDAIFSSVYWHMLTQWHPLQSQTFFLLEVWSLRLCSQKVAWSIWTADDSCITKQIVTAYAHSISVTLYCTTTVLRFHPVVRARRGNPAHTKLRHVSRDFGPAAELLDDGREENKKQRFLPPFLFIPISRKKVMIYIFLVEINMLLTIC